MFQLNKKLLVIIILVLLLGFAGTTAYLIYKENHKDFILKYPNKNIEKIDTKYAVNLNGKYNTNDLLIEDKYYKLSDNDSYGYDSFDGLKDSKYQDKINSDILKTVKSFAKKDNLGYCYTRANYSNILSVMCYYSKKDNEENEFYYGFNYNLKDEKDLSFEELFVDNAPILSIITKSYYNKMILLNKDKSPDEMIRIIIDEYNKGNYIYYFDNESIFIIIKDTKIEISMKKYYKYIAIFDRFKDGKNIYKDSSIGFKDVMPLSVNGINNNSKEDSYLGYQSDYFYVSFSYETLEGFLNDYKDSKITNKVLKEIYSVYSDEIKKIPSSYKNDNKGVMLFGDLSLSESKLKFYNYETNEIFKINPYLYSYECSKSVFKDKFVPYFVTYDNKDINAYKKNIKKMGVTTKEVTDEYYVIYKDEKAYSKKKLELDDIFKDVNKIKEDILDTDFLKGKEDEIEDLRQNGKLSYEIKDNYMIVTLTSEKTSHSMSLQIDN